MGFEDGALARLRRYRENAKNTVSLSREAEEAARRFTERLFGGLEYVASIGRDAGLGIETSRQEDLLAIRLNLSGARAGAEFGLVNGTAAETDEELMHEALSNHLLKPSAYSGRILGWSENVGEGPCQVFAVYRDGVWKTKGIFVERARGKITDPDDVLGGFCLRILGRLIDLAAPTEWAGRRWSEGPYTPDDLLNGKSFPTKTRWLH